jgi:hypothetical protein
VLNNLERLFGGLHSEWFEFYEHKSELFHELPEVATWSLGIISEFLDGRGKTKTAFVEMAGRRNFRIYTDLQTAVR